MNETIDLKERQSHLPFDQHQRYRVVAEALERLRGDSGARLRILDVGGAEGTVLNFLDRDEVTILDQVAVEGVPGFVRGDATALPFEDGSFDYATSVDTFEHIASEARERYLSELRRVARKGVLLAAPFEGGGVREAEELANEFFRALYGQGCVWLEEHEAHGLPELDGTRTFYEELGDSVTVLPNGYLPNWLPMICLFFYSIQLEGEPYRMAQRVNQFYNRFLYEHDNVEPCYRYLVIALKEPTPVELGGLASPLTNPERANLASALLGSLTSALPLWAELRKLNVQLARKDNLLAQKEVQVRDVSLRLAAQVRGANAQQQKLQQENQNLRRQRNRLRNRLETMTNSRTWRMVSLLGKLRRPGR